VLKQQPPQPHGTLVVAAEALSSGYAPESTAPMATLRTTKVLLAAA
jgi:hypothetical protein